MLPYVNSFYNTVLEEAYSRSHICGQIYIFLIFFIDNKLFYHSEINISYHDL